MLECDAFLRSYYPSAVDFQSKDVSRFINRVNEVIDGDNYEGLKDKATVCKLFYLQRLSSITRTHYQKIKEYLINLYDWLDVAGVIPSHEEVIKAGEYICFFRDLDSALKFIDNVGSLKLKNYNPLEDLVTIKTIYILGWYGLSLSDVAGLKKDDVQRKKNGDGYIEVPNGKIEIQKEYFDIIEAQKRLISYQSLPNGILRTLKGSEAYLFRTTSEDCEEIKSEHIVQMLKRFNANVPFYLKQNIAFRYIRTNALFVDIYRDTSDKPLIKKVEDATKCSPKQAYSYRTQYLAWVEMIENGII